MSEQRPWNIAGDVIFTPSESGMIASNHRSKTHIWVNIDLLNALLGQSRGEEFHACDLTVPANVEGLLADPTGLSRSRPDRIIKFETLNHALVFLEERMIVVRDQATYSNYFAKRESLLDLTHLGTFHQRLGTDLRLRYRVDPDDWWYSQKYDPNTGDVKDNLYKHIQSAFIEEFAKNLELDGRNVLDFGCGSGLAAEHFISGGANVWGADPSDALLEKAKGRLAPGFHPIKLILESECLLSGIPDKEFDLIWLGDVLLFYFYPMDGGDPLLAPADLLSKLRERLTQDGRLVIMHPHGYFWLTPWLGHDDMPFTILTEYSNRIYSVSPSLEEMSSAIYSAGLTIDRIYEPLSERDPKNDRRAENFAQNFPLWWAFECRKGR
ncbi:MAG: hypothetical protein CMM59_10960 [Rhodospirillaceae bacterium]|nr:hypothetical protein [Rhodospirillaceae bacterium]